MLYLPRPKDSENYDTPQLPLVKFIINCIWNHAITSTIFFLNSKKPITKPLKSHWHFWQGPPKNDWINFWWICTWMQKISLFHLLSYRIQSILESHVQTDPPKTSPSTPIFDHANPINFYQLLIFVNLYLHVKNQLYYICSFFRHS